MLATKYGNAFPGKDPNAVGNHRKSMVQAVQGSLKRLQTGYGGPFNMPCPEVTGVPLRKHVDRPQQ